MKTVFLHGLGQTADDWKDIGSKIASDKVECPALFSMAQNDLCYAQILTALERRYAAAEEPLCLCGLSLGGMLALDYTLRHPEKVGALVLIGVQYRVPGWLVDVQNLVFHCMPDRMFKSMGVPKGDVIKLAHSMRELDFTAKLKSVRCSVTILCGEKDHANKKAAKRVKSLLPQAKLYMVPGAGHELNRDAPEVIVEVLQNIGQA